MSGFFGVFNPGGQIDLVAFDQMKSAIYRDGYDELETYTDDRIAMGHLMLRVTPESVYDKQPLKSNCGRFILIGHFRLDYRDELGDKIGLTQKQLENTPDSLLVMKAYQKWGRKCVHHLEGDWSFVLFDYLMNQLFVGKDSTGISSVFYININGSLFFSSDPCVFSKLLFFKAELDETQFLYFSVQGLKIDKGKTLFKDLNCLQNGCFVMFDNKIEVDFNRYYNIFKTRNSKLYKFDTDLFFELKSIYCKAVKSRCRSRFEVGIFLSSGLDSMSVATVSALELEHQGKCLNSFTSVPSRVSNLTSKEKEYADESVLVEKVVAKQANIKANFCRFDDFKLSDLDLAQLEINPFSPSLTLNYFWINGIFKIAKINGIRSIMSGQIGNFTISADGYFVHLELLQRFQFKKLFLELKAYAEVQKIGFVKAFKIRILNVLKYKLKTFIRAFSKFSNIYFANYGTLNLEKYQKFKSSFRSKNHDLIPDYFYVSSQRTLRLNQLDKNLFFSNSYWYLYSSFFGIEVLDPTSDERVVDFSLSIPEELFFKLGVRKFLYNGVFSDLVDEKIIKNLKPGIQSYDFGERLVSDKKFIERLLGYEMEETLFNSQLFKQSLKILYLSDSPNRERKAISKILHFISVHNFSRRFKSTKFGKTSLWNL